MNNYSVKGELDKPKLDPGVGFKLRTSVTTVHIHEMWLYPNPDVLMDQTFCPSSPLLSHTPC